MKILNILPILVLSLFIASCSSDDDIIHGSGNLSTETRELDSFNQVSSLGVFDVSITQGSSQSVEIIADDNIIHHVNTIVEDGQLKLSLDDDNYRNISLQANIVVERINGITNSGVGDITISNVDESGSFNIFNSGTGNISIQGTAESLAIENEGTGKFKGFLFTVSDCEIEIIGSGDCEVNVTNTLDVDIAGSGDVHYKGSPSLNTTISGSGSIVNAN